MSRLRTVLVGFGAVADTLGLDRRMARYFPKASHAAILADHPAFEWQAVVDPSEEARARASRRWNVAHAVADLGALPDPASFDCAVIATPPHMREAILDRLPGLRAVLFEKPVAETLAAAERLAGLCERRGIAAQVNYWRRGVDGFRALAGGGLAGHVGAPRAVFGVYGGGLANTGSHMIDFVRMLLGEVAEAMPAREAPPAADARIAGDIAAEIALRLETGVPVRLLPLDFSDYREASLDIWGTAGRLAIEQESLVTRAFPLADNRGLEEAREVASDRPLAIDIPVGGAFMRLYDNLAEAALSGAPLISPLRSALVTERLVHTIRGGTLARSQE